MTSKKYSNFLSTYIDNPDEFKKIIEEDGLNIEDEYGTLLHAMAELEEYKLVIQMINEGINVNALNCYGSTALHYAAEANDEIMVKILLKGGCNPDIRNNGGYKAEDLTSNEKILVLLSEWQELPTF